MPCLLALALIIAVLVLLVAFFFWVHGRSWCDTQTGIGDGRGFEQILYSADPRYTPQWTPDGQHIVFVQEGFKHRDRSSIPASIYLIKIDGTGLRRLSQGERGYEIDYSPDISPDGSRIVYTTSRHLSYSEFAPCNRVRNFDIETIRLDGTAPHRLTANEYLDTYPTWSPDGSLIGYWGHGLTLSTPDGLKRRTLFTTSKSYWGIEEDQYVTGPQDHPTWSPDGKKLAFVSMVDDPNARGTGKPTSWYVIYVAAVDGSNLTRLFTSGDRSKNYISGSPVWSPDGQSLAFGYYEVETGTGSLNTVNPDGSDLRKMVVLDKEPRGLPSNIDWAPDRSTILFSFGRDPKSYLYVVNRDGTGLHRIGDGLFVSWSPDGSRIAKLTRQTGRTGRLALERDSTFSLSTMAVDGSDVTELVKLEDDQLWSKQGVRWVPWEPE